MAHSGSDSAYQDLPATWPFRLAGTLTIIAMVWFCLGFAIEDMGEKLSGHMPVFWLLLLAAALLTLGGGVFNVSRERRRKRTA